MMYALLINSHASAGLSRCDELRMLPCATWAAQGGGGVISRVESKGSAACTRADAKGCVQIR